MITQLSIVKKLLMTSLAVAALTLSACADKDAMTTEGDATGDAQTEVEQQATGVDDVEQVADDVNSTVTSDDPLVNDSASAEANDSMVSADELATNDGTEVTVIDETEILDGSETEEHVSTY